MKVFALWIIISGLLSLPLSAQQNNNLRSNNTLRGKILFLSSAKTPAIGVEMYGEVEGKETSNKVYTTDKGYYQLIFPKARDGYSVKLKIGETDQYGKSLEVVNDKEVEECKIPAIASDEFEIIVCEKGSRDLVAQRYYKIIKTSSDIALAKIKKEVEVLSKQQEKDYQKITELNEKITKLEQQTDSLAIYKEAFRIASINKDYASQRVLQYIQLLDKGKNIQEAMKVLSIQNAKKEANNSIRGFKNSIEELEIYAGISISIFEYQEAIACYDTIIYLMEEIEIDPLKIALYYHEAGKVIYKNGQYEQALEYHQKAIDIQEEILNPKHIDLAIAYTSIGLTYYVLGKYEQALKYHKKAISIEEEILDPKHIELVELASAYNNIALAYDALSKYDSALLYNQKAIEIEETLDSKHPNLAHSYNNIALLLQSLGKYEQALKYQQKTINLQKEILDPKHPELAMSYNNIALILQSLGQYKQALEYQQKAIGIQEEVLHSNHPDLANAYDNIGNTYSYLGQYEQALKYQQKAIGLQEKILTSKHPELATSYNNISNTYSYLGQYEQALKYQQKAIGIQEEIFAPKHSLLAISYNNIGITYSHLDQYEEALIYQQKSIGILKEILGPKHHDLAALSINIAGTYRDLGQFEKALEYGQKAISIMEEILDPKHPNLAASYSSIGNTYRALNQYEKALIYHQKAIDIQEKILGSKHPKLGTSYSKIASTYKGMKVFYKAIQYQEMSLDIFRESLPSNHPYQQKAFNGLMEIYEARGIDAFEKKDYSSALADFDTIHVYADSSYANLGQIWNYTGFCHFYLGDYLKAIEAYQKAVILLPRLKDKDYYDNIGLAYAKNKQFKEAKVAFTKYEKLFPNEGRIYRNRAIYYALQNEIKKAIFQLQKAVKFGYNDWKWLEADDSMDILREEKVFIKILKKLKKENPK